MPLLKLRKLDVSLTADDLSRLVETVETMQDAAELSGNAATAIKSLAMTDPASTTSRITARFWKNDSRAPCK